MIGQTLSHFKVTAKLGEGGMGEVYRAEDTKLGREVAIKVLPEAVAEDAERLARFEREAKVLASLNHPQIAAIYSLESATAHVGEPLVGSRDGSVGEPLVGSREGTSPSPTTAGTSPSPTAEGAGSSPTKRVNFLVMELVEGDTLQERVARGVLPPDEAIPIAVQIAEAIEAAHEKGIIHRDLKPANIKLTSEGQVKVLDFGLAKALDPGAVTGTDQDRNQSPQSLSLSPTLTAQMTQAGVILGTAAYMSPEQARGQEADERSDIWAYGVVLYEMLTGRPGFRGDTVSDTLASILKEELDFDALPADTPRAVRRVLDRSLEKNPKDRLHSIADARIDLQSSNSRDVGQPSGESPPTGRRVGWSGLMAAVVAGALLTLGLMQLLPGSSTPDRESQPLHLTIKPPGELVGAFDAVISRQGDFVVFRGFDGSTIRLHLRRLGAFETDALPGTDGGSHPAISPDGQWVAFVADGKLKKVAIAGGHPLVLGDLSFSSPGIRWGPGDSILYTPTWVGSGLHRISADGGEPEPLTELDRAAGELGHWWPHGLPGDKKILFTLWPKGSGLNDAEVAVLDLETGETQTLFDGARAQYLASGHVLYYHAGNFYVVPFDIDTMTTTGPSVVVLPDATREEPNGGSSIVTGVSDDGTLVYLPKSPDRQLAWFDRQGNQTLWPFEPISIFGIDLGPDGRLAATILEGGAYQIRVLDPESGTEEQFAFGGGSFFDPVWHPDGQTIAYSGLITGSFDVVVKTSGQADPKILLSTDFDEKPTSWSADGSQLIHEQFDDQGKVHIRAISANDPSESVVLTLGPASDRGARVSPDGRWLAFHSDRAGRSEVYVQRFPEADRVFKVSRSGGFGVRWAEDGESLYYQYGLEIFEANFREEDGRFVVESESRVLELPLFSGGWDVAPDGRFVAAIPVEKAISDFKVITNWFDELERIAPTGSKAGEPDSR